MCLIDISGTWFANTLINGQVERATINVPVALMSKCNILIFLGCIVFKQYFSVRGEKDNFSANLF